MGQNLKMQSKLMPINPAINLPGLIKRTAQQQSEEEELTIPIDAENFSFFNLFNGMQSALETRHVYLTGEINELNIISVISQIHILEKKGEEDISLFINSDGGVIQDCLALIDVMDVSPCDIATYTIGRAASAACLIASNGTVGKRFAGPNAAFMFHEVYGDVFDFKYSNLSYYRDLFNRETKRVNKIFSRNTGKTIKEIKNLFLAEDLDKWLTSEEAVKFGIIDKVMSIKRKKHNPVKPVVKKKKKKAQDKQE